MVPLFMFIIFCLLFLCFLKFTFPPSTIVPGLPYDTWNFPSVTFFVNKHDYTKGVATGSDSKKEKETSCL